ncbi:MAG: hypothetical protein HWE20_03520 [Gammaproteobacteria bacterium]|nr:hypothetical protein [Gammaproteobacteria bacterium]
MNHEDLRQREPWRPDELVLSPEDLEQIKYIEDARRLQAGIAILNFELQRLFNDPRLHQ